MRTVLRRYYSLYVLHTCMRESEKQGKNKNKIFIVLVIVNASEYNLKWTLNLI